VIITLSRFSYSPTETEGRLEIPGEPPFATIELPWRDNQKGLSCVPDGRYQLLPFRRPSGEEAFILRNPALKVWHRDEDIPPGVVGRSLILIHAANFPHELRGCIAPGVQRGLIRSSKTGLVHRGVSDSRYAMEKIRELLGKEEHTLVIRPSLGAVS
jgi:hypothetical protein